MPFRGKYTHKQSGGDDDESHSSDMGYGHRNRKNGKTKRERNPERKTTGGAFSFLKGALTARQVKTDELSPDDIIIAVMGPTGSGKSTFINIITNLDTGVGHSLQSCTSEVSNIRLSMPELADGDLVFVDTPGFDDTHKSDVDILKMVADWLKSTYSKDILLSGLLYFHRISDNRMAGTPLKNLRMFEELCGKNAFQNVILTTTMWDDVDKETGEAREEELKTKYWRSMLERNSTTSRFLRTRESAFALIDPLIDAANIRSSVLLQQEMVDMRHLLPATSAGQALFSKMELLVKQREQLLNRIRIEMKRADDDEMALAPLQEEHQKLRMNLELTVNEMRRLKLPLGQRLIKISGKFLSDKFTFWMSKIPRPNKGQLSAGGPTAAVEKSDQADPLLSPLSVPSDGRPHNNPPAKTNNDSSSGWITVDVEKPQTGSDPLRFPLPVLVNGQPHNGSSTTPNNRFSSGGPAVGVQNHSISSQPPPLISVPVNVHFGCRFHAPF